VNEPVVDMDRKRDSELTRNEPDAASSLAFCVGFIFSGISCPWICWLIL